MADLPCLSFEHIYALHLDSNLMWKEGNATPQVLENTKNAYNAASNSGIHKVVFDIATGPAIIANDAGFARFNAVIANAKEKMVRIAFRITSNTAFINEFDERYADNDTVGYRYDNSIGLAGISDTVKGRIITANITDLDTPAEKLCENVPFTAIVFNNDPELNGMIKE